MTRKLCVAFLSALCLAPLASAQEKAGAPAAPPPAPKMSAEGRKFLDGWLGHWTSTDTVYTMGGQKMPGSLKMACESVSSGWGTLCHGTMTSPGMPPSEGTFLMAWDIATGEGHMFEVVDTGEVHDHSGKWLNDKSVSLVREGKNLEGKTEKDACTVSFLSASELKLDCTGTQAGVTLWTFTSTSKK